MVEINAIGENCPIPVVKAKNALQNCGENETIVIWVDNKIATENLEKLAKVKNCSIVVERIENDKYKVILNNTGRMEVNNLELQQNKTIDELMTRTNSIIVIGSNKMGVGSEDLGEILLKGFIYALTETETIQDAIIFYNSGVKLACEGSSSVEDLKKLIDRGIKIYACGACLSHYGLSEKLLVGEITNMYNIVEMKMNADKIIYP